MPFGIGEKKPTKKELEKPEELRSLVKQEKYGDCLSCKLLGGSALVGLGFYSYFSGRYQLRQQQAAILKSGSMFGMRTRQAGITGLSMVLAGMGVWRFIN